MTGDPLRVASLVWRLPSELHEAQADAVSRLGHVHQFLWFNEKIHPDTDVVLVQGPYGTLAPLGLQLRSLPSDQRPILVYWFQQNLDFLLPNWIRVLLAPAFSDLTRSDRHRGLPGDLLNYLLPRMIREKGGRLRFLGDILWLHREGLLDVLALTGTVYAKYLRHFGVNSVVVQRGHHPSYGEDLNKVRDIAVVWMGQTRSRRRRRVIYRLNDELQGLGHAMQIYDGVQHRFIFGDERTRILNRARFVLNVLSHPEDELSIRYFIAAANGAVVLTEPGRNTYPFKSDVHLVQTPVEFMPEMVDYYVQHEEERRQIAESMLRLIRTEFTLERSIGTLLDLAQRRITARSVIPMELSDVGSAHLQKCD
jgi:hypothetical protein